MPDINIFSLSYFFGHKFPKLKKTFLRPFLNSHLSRRLAGGLDTLKNAFITFGFTLGPRFPKIYSNDVKK